MVYRASVVLDSQNILPYRLAVAFRAPDSASMMPSSHSSGCKAGRMIQYQLGLQGRQTDSLDLIHSPASTPQGFVLAGNFN
jgi:hypothetical protein